MTDDPLLQVAPAAHLGRYRGQSGVHTESDLHVYLRWCAERDIEPLAARRSDVELYADDEHASESWLRSGAVDRASRWC